MHHQHLSAALALLLVAGATQALESAELSAGFFDAVHFPDAEGEVVIDLDIINFGSDGEGLTGAARVFRGDDSSVGPTDELLLDSTFAVPEPNRSVTLPLPIPTAAIGGTSWFRVCLTAPGSPEVCQLYFSAIVEDTARAASDRRVRYLGDFAVREGFSYKSVAVMGGLAIVKRTTGSRLGAEDNIEVYDISDLGEAIGTDAFANRPPIGTLRTLEAEGVEVNFNQGGLLEIGDRLFSYGRAGVEEIDLTDPTRPASGGLVVDQPVDAFAVQDGRIALGGSTRAAVYRIEASGPWSMTHDLGFGDIFSIAFTDEWVFMTDIQREIRGISAFRLLPEGGVVEAPFTETGVIPSTALIADQAGERLLGLGRNLVFHFEIEPELALTNPGIFGSRSMDGRSIARGPDGTLYTGRVAVRANGPFTFLLGYEQPSRPAFGFDHPGDVEGSHLFEVTNERIQVYALPQPQEFEVAAVDIVSPVAATVIEGSEFFPVSRLIDQSGLPEGVAGDHEGGDSNWATEAPTGPGDYLAANPPPVLDLDLGSDRLIDGLVVWPYTVGNGNDVDFQANSARDFNLRFATEADGPEGFGADTDYFVVGQPSAALEPVGRREVHRLDAPRTARYVRMTITDNHFGSPGSGGGDRIGLGEVAFVIPAELLFRDSFERPTRR